MSEQIAGEPPRAVGHGHLHRILLLALAEGLKKRYEPPQELSPQLARLLARLEVDLPIADPLQKGSPRATVESG